MIDKHLVNLNERRYQYQFNKITVDTAQIQIISIYFENLYSDKLKNPEEIHRILDIQINKSEPKKSKNPEKFNDKQ